MAAIGGVVQRTLDSSMEQMEKVRCEGVLDRMNGHLKDMRRRLQETVKFVSEKRDSAYSDLVARDLVEMEIYLYTGRLMLRDALKNPEREPLTEKFIVDALPEFEARHRRAMSNDYTTIDNHRTIIDY